MFKATHSKLCVLGLCSLALAPLGCDASDEEEHAESDATAFCQAYYQLILNKMGECCTPEEQATFDSSAKRLESCPADVHAAVSDDSFGFQPDAAASCLKEFGEVLAQASCGDPTRFEDLRPTACSTVLQGTLPAGAVCHDRAQCAAGSTCVPDCPDGRFCGVEFVGETLLGHCGPPPKASEGCNDDMGYTEFSSTASCVAGNTCEFTYDDAESYSFRCFPAAKLGESCLVASCEAGLMCGYQSVCTTPGVEGEPCPCGEGFYCGCIDPQHCVSGNADDNICKPLAPAGAECDSFTDGCLGECGFDNVCASVCGSG